MSSFVVTPVDGQARDEFGGSMAVSADGLTMVVGSSLDDVAGHRDQGSARVFVWNGSDWIQKGRPIIPDSLGLDSYFPTDCDISADGQTLLIGWMGDGTYRGSARVFDWNGAAWVQRGVLTAPTGSTFDGFGNAVRLSADGRTAVIGSSRDDIDGQSDRGSGWVFDWNGTAWTLRGSPLGITDPQGARSDFFGDAVALSNNGSTVIFGAPYDDSAQVFTWNGTAWARRGDPIRPASVEFAGWGTSVDMSADGLTVVVGGSNDKIDGQAALGSARVFDWNGSSWVQRGQALTAPTGGAIQYFGHTTAMTPDGMTVIVGGPYARANGLGGGGAYVFDWNGAAWVQRGGFVAPSDRQLGDYFGYSLDISDDGRIAFIGASLDDVAYTDQGSVRVFEWNGTSWVEGLIPGAHPAVAGGAGRILPGSTGNDTYVVTHQNDLVTEASNGGFDTVFVMADDWIVASNLEAVYLAGTATRLDGSEGSDQLAANPAHASILRGNGGDDVLWGGSIDGSILYGGDGNDTLYAGTGATHMSGGWGSDQYLVKNLGDTIDESAVYLGTDTVWVGVSGWTVPKHIEIVRLMPGVTSLVVADYDAQVVSSVDGAVITATNPSTGPGVTFWGQGGADTFIGAAGNDIFRPGLGITSMQGRGGNDQYVINNAAHTVIEAAGEGTDTAWVSVNGWTVGENVEVAYLSDTATTITGNASSTILVANPLYSSTLIAGTGPITFWSSELGDVLHIGAGGGTTYLKGGADRLVFGEHWGVLHISDFRPGEGDTLDFRSSGLTKADLTIRIADNKVFIEHAGDQAIIYHTGTMPPDTAFLF